MKKFIQLTTVFLFVLTAAPAFAMLIPTTDIGMAANDGWWSKTNNSILGPSNKGGFAWGFSTDQSYHVSMVESFIKAVGDSLDAGQVSWALYNGTTTNHDNAVLPGSELAYKSQTFDIPVDGVNHGYAEATDIDLNAGDHWLVFNGYVSPPSYSKVTGYQFEGDQKISNFAQIHNPEPATLLLLGGGLVGALRKRKRVV